MESSPAGQLVTWECEGDLSVAAGQSVDILDHVKAHGNWRDDQCPAGPQGAGLQLWEGPIVHHH